MLQVPDAWPAHARPVSPGLPGRGAWAAAGTACLRGAGLRVTLPRLLVLQALSALAEDDEEITAIGLVRRFAMAEAPLGAAACYQILAAFEAAGLLRKRADERQGRAVFLYALRMPLPYQMVER